MRKPTVRSQVALLQSVLSLMCILRFVSSCEAIIVGTRGYGSAHGEVASGSVVAKRLLRSREAMRGPTVKSQVDLLQSALSFLVRLEIRLLFLGLLQKGGCWCADYFF